LKEHKTHLCEDELPDEDVYGELEFSAVLFIDENNEYWICKSGYHPVCIGVDLDMNFNVELLNRDENLIK
jgi:hypothetical protein